MKKTPEACVRHPERLTYRRCYTCKKPVCFECQVVRSHHIFCSDKCWLQYKWVLFRNRLRNLLRRAPLRQANWQNITLIILTLAVVGMGIIISRLASRVKELTPQAAKASTGGVAPLPVLAQASEEVKITKPVQGAMVHRNIITITGEADDNIILALLAGEQVEAVTLPHNGHFSFTNVRVRRGRNSFVVRALKPNGESIDLEKIEFSYSAPALSYLMRPLHRGSLAEKKIALTFDGGSSNNITNEILAILRAAKVKCTMFLTGKFIERYPETVRQIVQDGHEVGNHTYSHPHLTTYAQNCRHDTRPGVTRELIQQELRRTAELFEKVTGKKMAPLWRAPYGECNAEICAWAAEIGYRQIDWTWGRDINENMDTLDWVANTENPTYYSAEEIKAKILAFADKQPHGANGAIILMHLASQRHSDYPHRKLPEIISGLRNKGYQLVKVSELSEPSQ